MANTVEILISLLRQGRGASEATQELAGLQRATKMAGSSLTSFDTSSQAAYASLLQTSRASGMTAQEVGGLASSLGVASESQVQARIQMDSLIAAWNKGEISSAELTQGLSALGQGTEEAAEGATGLARIIDTGVAAAFVKGAVEVGRMAYQLGELGARSIRTRTAFTNISGGADEAGARLEAMQRATRGAISEMDAMAAANRLMQMGLATNATELENVTTMAVRLGTAMGRDANAAIEEFALLLANQSIPRLDTFGISAGRVRTRINELRDANQDLTREQAFLQAVQEEGAKAMQRLGDAVDDEALAFEQAQAAAADFEAELGERLAPTISTVIKAGLRLITWSEDMREALLGHRGDVLLSAKSYEEYKAELIRAAHAAGFVVDAVGTLSNASGTYIQKNYILSESMFNVQRAMAEMGEEVVRSGIVPMGSLEDRMREAAGATEEMGEATEGAMHKAGRWIVYGERMTGQAEAYAEEIERAASKADEATPLFGGLAESVLDVGHAFAQGIPDTQDMWNMILQTGRAAGMNVEQLGALASSMGVADDATVQATLAGYRIVEAWNAGSASSQDMIRVTGALTTYEEELALAEEAVADGDEVAAEAHRLAAERALELALSLGDAEMAAGDAEERIRGMVPGVDAAEGALDDAAGAARRFQEALSRIEREIKVDVTYEEHGQRPGGGGTQQYQMGTIYHPGGLALVHGPELLELPRGTQVHSVSETSRALYGATGGYDRKLLGGGDRFDQRRYYREETYNYYVEDRLAAAMVLEDARRRRDRRIEEGF